MLLNTQGGADHRSGATVCEYLAHPGMHSTDKQGGCGAGLDAFAQSPARETELAVLCDPYLQQQLKQQAIDLISYEDLAQDNEE